MHIKSKPENDIGWQVRGSNWSRTAATLPTPCKPRQFTAEEKAAIVRRHMVDKVPLSDLCDEYEIHPSILDTWHQQVIDNLAWVFESSQADDGLWGDTALWIHHDRTEEHIQVTLQPRSGAPLDLGAHAHHVVLLALARARIEDRNLGIAPTQEGWIHRDELSARLRLEVSHVNIMIHRLRRQLARNQVRDFTSVVERQPGLGMLRVGPSAIQIIGD